jgi:hypothetical protein
LAAVHAAGGDVGEEFAEDEVEGDGILEIAAEGEEFGADFFSRLELEEFAMVEEAECLARVAEHAAAAAVGELEVAARVRVAIRAVRFFCGHENGGLVSLGLFLPRGASLLKVRLWWCAAIGIRRPVRAKEKITGLNACAIARAKPSKGDCKQ